MAARTPPAGAGLRAMPSQAAAAMRPCPNPPPNAAMATPKPAASASVVGLRGAFCSGAPLCANAAGTTSNTTTRATKTTAAFFIYCLLMNCRQEVVPGHRAAGLTLERLTKSLMLVCRGHADVNGRQNRKHVGLHNGNEHVQKYECDGNQGWQHPNDYAKNWRSAPTAGERAGE